MYSLPSRQGPRTGPRRSPLRDTLWRAKASLCSESGDGQKATHRMGFVRRARRISIIGLLLIAGFAAGLQASEAEKVHRTGEVGTYAPVPIHSLPVYRSDGSASQASAPVSGQHAALARAIQETAVLQDQSESEQDPAPSSVSSLGSRIIRGKLARGQSVSSVLRRNNVSPQMVRKIDQGVRSKFDFRKAQPGDSFRMSLDENGELISFRYRPSLDEIVVLRQSMDGYTVEREAIPLQSKLERMHGTVESSLYKSIRGMGHDPVLASAFADIFAWDIDFTRHLKAGDGFTILYEKLYLEDEGEEVYVRPGRILAAKFDGSAGEHTAVYFEEEDGIGHYFRPDGGTLEQEYLVAPLKYSRVSSKYSTARNHPILKVVRPHHGIDYAARAGTPLWSVADGEVIFRGVNGGFGNLVKIRHAGGYVSYYAHMSGFSTGLKVGQKVRQQQIIGYVGQTGLATGPHVCFRVTKHGKYVNPASLNHNKPVNRSVADASWSDFELVRDQLLADLREGRPSEFAGNAL